RLLGFLGSDRVAVTADRGIQSLSIKDGSEKWAFVAYPQLAGVAAGKVAFAQMTGELVTFLDRDGKPASAVRLASRAGWEGAISPDGKALVSGSFFDLGTGGAIQLEHVASAFSPDGRWLATAMNDSSVALRDVDGLRAAAALGKWLSRAD